jgi:hypothetical protein
LREGGNKTANAFLIEAKEEGKIFQNSTSEGRKKDLSQSIWKACRSKTVLLVSSNDFIEISSLLKRKYFKYFFSYFNSVFSGIM